ncbi:MAG TPA: metalloregulator ArsR/SmtB family transcription factor [Candidatus Acidoferrum sp.]|jgi:DNA-binding transcriptional ArsR family regulator|nr:metalloregulator ArsR/SmtB family transcription factor [Candidatus Acidoferrum sp.]
MVNNCPGLDAVFSALADPTRRRIVERLARGRLTVGEIASEFSVSQPAISKHLKVLERAGLLERQIDGRVHNCRLDPKAMQEASTWIEEQRRFWEAAFSRLDDYFARNPERNDKP